MMFSPICHHFVLGGEEKWKIPIRESCGVGEGEGLKKLTSLFLIPGLYFSVFRRTISLDVKS